MGQCGQFSAFNLLLVVLVLLHHAKLVSLLDFFLILVQILIFLFFEDAAWVLHGPQILGCRLLLFMV